MHFTSNLLMFVKKFRKKSVDDLLATSQDVINSGISQALSTATALSTTASSLSLNRDRRRSPSPSNRSGNISTSPRNSATLYPKTSNKNEIQTSSSNSKLDNAEVISFTFNKFYLKMHENIECNAMSHGNFIIYCFNHSVCSIILNG